MTKLLLSNSHKKLVRTSINKEIDKASNQKLFDEVLESSELESRSIEEYRDVLQSINISLVDEFEPPIGFADSFDHIYGLVEQGN